MMATLITLALLMQLPGMAVVMGMCRAAANGDRQLAECSIEQGMPHVAAMYLAGAAA